MQLEEADDIQQHYGVDRATLVDWAHSYEERNPGWQYRASTTDINRILPTSCFYMMKAPTDQIANEMHLPESDVEEIIAIEKERRRILAELGQ